MYRRLAITAALCALFVFFFNGGQKETVSPVRVAVPYSVSSLPLLDLNGKTIEGLSIEVSVFRDHSLTLAEFLRGDIDILMTGFTQGTAAFAGNRDVRHLATVVWGVSSLVVSDPALKKLEDLAGKKVGVPFAKSPLDLQLRSILGSRGLAGKVIIEYAPPPQAAALLLAGKLDAAALPEPLPSQLEAGGTIFRMARFQDLWAGVSHGEARSPQVSLFVKESFTRTRQIFINAFVRTADAAITAVTVDPKAAASRHAAAFKLDPAVVEKGLEHTLFGVPGRSESRALIDDYLKRIGIPSPEPLFFYEH